MKRSAWGWLFPLRDGFPSLELRKDEYTVGRDSGCGYVIPEPELSRADYASLSKKQFRILRKKDTVYLEDLGGTYVNDRKIGPRQKCVLAHKDRIAVAQMHIRVFSFLRKSESELESAGLPTDINRTFLLSHHLGRGSYGEVSLVFEKETCKRYAMKIVRKNPNLIKYACTEAEIMRTLSHPCIITTRLVLDTVSTLFIVMELMEGGDLRKRIHVNKHLAEKEAKLIFFQLVQAIQYLHQFNVVHRDIKPENVLLASRSPDTLVKVTDFGVSKIIRPGTVMDTYVGTTMYKAPEILRGVQHEYTKQVDVWSLGVLLYFSLSGTFPFPKTQDVTSSRGVTFPPQCFASLSSVVSLIKDTLQTNPTQRIDIDGILAHSWLRDDTMHRKAHKLMWPHIPYAETVQSTVKRSVSVTSQAVGARPRGVLQFMSQRFKPQGIPPRQESPKSVQAKIQPQTQRGVQVIGNVQPQTKRGVQGDGMLGNVQPQTKRGVQGNGMLGNVQPQTQRGIQVNGMLGNVQPQTQRGVQVNGMLGNVQPQTQRGVQVQGNMAVRRSVDLSSAGGRIQHVSVLRKFSVGSKPFDRKQ